MVRPTLIDSNPIKLNYYLSSLDKCNIRCNAVDDIYLHKFVFPVK